MSVLSACARVCELRGVCVESGDINTANLLVACLCVLYTVQLNDYFQSQERRVHLYVQGVHAMCTRTQCGLYVSAAPVCAGAAISRATVVVAEAAAAVHSQ